MTRYLQMKENVIVMEVINLARTFENCLNINLYINE